MEFMLGAGVEPEDIPEQEATGQGRDLQDSVLLGAVAVVAELPMLEEPLLAVAAQVAEALDYWGKELTV
jgi:hypothetical protein